MTDVRTAALTEQSRFDQGDRDRIRRTLLRYMEENRIGVPTLQKLVAGANDVGLDNVPLKTLQRFLGDTHRSNDIMVRFCYRFAQQLPDDDPMAAIGEALVGFLGVVVGKDEWRALPSSVFGQYAGRTEPPPKGMVALRTGYDHWVPYSDITVATAAARPFALVRETVKNWQRSESATTGTARRVYEGVLFHPSGSMFAVLRNVLTGAPRLHWLVPSPPFPLAGHCHESTSALDGQSTPHLFEAVTVVFSKVAEGRAS